MDQRIIDLYDEYTHVHLDRRRFLERAAILLGGTAPAAAALAALQSNYAKAAVVAENDPRIKAEKVTFPGASGQVKGYLAEPAGSGKHGSIVVIHQNRGLNPHIEDIARRLATAGYVALGVDFLSPQGGTPADENQAAQMFGKIDRAQAVGDAKAAVAWLRGRPEVNGKVGAIGFCWGGGTTLRLAAAEPSLSAATVFYGDPPEAAAVAQIKAPLLLNYSDPKVDTRIGAMLPDFEAAMKAANIKNTFYIYPGANHAFNDDTAGERYNAEAAKLAWDRTLEFFGKNLA